MGLISIMQEFYRQKVFLHDTLILFFLFLMLLSCTDSSDKSASRYNYRLDRAFKGFNKEFGFNGTVLIAIDDNILFNKGYGFSDPDFGIKNIPSTKFMIGSLTKQFTAIAIMILVDEGKIKLSDTVNLYLPDFPNGGAITIKNLLSHTSGLPREGDYRYFIGDIDKNKLDVDICHTINDTAKFSDIKKNYTGDNEKYVLKNTTSFQDRYELTYMFHTLGLSTDSPPLSLSDGVLKLIETQRSRNVKNGECYLYSNYGYMMAGFIIEKITGEKYETFIEKRILLPLNMTSTGFGYNQENTTLLAQGYYKSGNTAIKMPIKVDQYIWPGSAGMIYSTTLDIFKLMNGMKLLLKEDTLEELFTPVVPTKIADTSYGMGYFITNKNIKNNMRKVIWHDGIIYNFRSIEVYFPQDSLKIVILCNNLDANNIYYWSYIIWEIIFGKGTVNNPKKIFVQQLQKVKNG